MPRVWKFGDSVNTGDILPGKCAPSMAAEDVFQTFAFHSIRPTGRNVGVR
ncbi:3-isopropylmalate dehydratase small subunit, leuD [Deinococcus aerius]|uniref:3-isopropylmalate dehydratase small subunit, leuD n=1 Tax=Deinococcus aerius TaxID=200253 RepID=A0A2I9CT19_9DEIO|nr:3-isopropylmalate dehydratase small subunit, leuD [Deinococcus aerius]